ncbi:hypothetical protein POM88_043778 [Heracleum sosnowskyi]|uniref:Uncharacterized protein n=1 Tax=Heracleum sosnowskyi TaxID=360622 RepID=A0AAD8H2Q0_9APIA|nr:hypothetical protein POM88_043778 [Heracleum sosnowskyi]
MQEGKGKKREHWLPFFLKKGSEEPLFSEGGECSGLRWLYMEQLARTRRVSNEVLHFLNLAPPTEPTFFMQSSFDPVVPHYLQTMLIQLNKLLVRGLVMFTNVKELKQMLQSVEEADDMIGEHVYDDKAIGAIEV